MSIDLLWGTRHLISPDSKLAGKDAMIPLLLLQTAADGKEGVLIVLHHKHVTAYTAACGAELPYTWSQVHRCRGSHPMEALLHEMWKSI